MTVELVSEDGTVVDGQENLALDVKGGSVLTAYGLQFRSNASGAVKVSGGSTEARLTECQIGPSAGIGLDLSGNARLQLERSRVLSNAKGGLELDSNEGSEISNVVVTANGDETTSFGGIHIKKTSATSRFVNNTVVNNRSKDGANEVAGVRCDPNGVQLVNSIVWGNLQPTGTSTASQRCEVHYSNLGPNSYTTGTNLSVDPLFADDVWFHLQPGSPCRNAADPLGIQGGGGPAPGFDVDGQPRPAGGLVDIGVDEIP